VLARDVRAATGITPHENRAEPGLHALRLQGFHPGGELLLELGSHPLAVDARSHAHGVLLQKVGSSRVAISTR
jgi:hypothetical protein